MFRVLVTCGAFEPGFLGGGPIPSVANIVDTIPDNIELRLITRDRDAGASEPYPDLSGRWIPRGRSQVFYANTRRIGHWLQVCRDISTGRLDLLYVNSVWDLLSVAPLVAMKLGLLRADMVLIAPRGELSPGALSVKSNKKRLFWRWWEPFLKSLKPVWHASTDLEAAEILAVAPWARILVNIDRVSLPDEPLPPTARNDLCRLVFIGRIVPKKNVDLVLRALRDSSKPVECDLYGPLEDPGYWSKCQSLIQQLPGHVRVAYRGSLRPAEVRRTFSAYDAFVFPTLGESFGHVIAESLSASCPVVCSDRTPWTSVLESGGGAVVRELTAEGLAHEISRIATMTAAQKLRAKTAAGDAFRSWRKGNRGPNVLEQALQSGWRS